MTIKLCANWWGGLGDCILYLSAANAYCKKHNTKINIGGCNNGIEKNMLDLIDIYKPHNDIQFNLIPRNQFIDKNGNEDHTNYDIYANDNYPRDVRELCYTPNRQIYGTYSILKVNGIPLDIPDFYFDYLLFPKNTTKDKRIITIQINGRSSGNLDNYFITISELNKMIEKFNKYYDFKILCDNIGLCKNMKGSAVIDSSNFMIADLFKIISLSTYHIGVDSGLSHVALSCKVPVITFKKRDTNNGLHLQRDDTILHPIEYIDECYEVLYEGLVE